MDQTPATRWQFSLRTLLLVMFACAVVAGVWTAFGTSALLWALFAALSVVPVVKLSGALKRAYLLSLLAVYGPFLVMATYTLMFVECSHCKETTWAMLPYEPGLIPLELAHHWVNMPRLYGAVANVTGFMFSVAVVSALMWLVRTRARWLQVLSLSGALLFFSFCAFVVLALVQA